MHTFNDWDEWLQMDKFGHIYTAYHISKSVALFNRWAGMKKVPAAIVGSAFALGYQTTLELLDGKSVEWGFSWGDMTANTIGAVAYASQEYFFDSQRILLKQSYHPTEYALLRPHVLGDNFVQRYLKDYNGQTYWFSFAPSQFSSKIPLPKWFCLSVGYGIDGKLFGTENTAVFDGITYNAQRRFLLSFDIDLTQLNIKNKTLKAFIKPFNAIKIPFPTIYWQNNTCYVKGLYF
jgi:YHS domain-containing protein